MKILGFDSSARTASVALFDDRRLVAQYFQNCGLTHSRTLLPMAEDMLKNLGVELDDIGLLAVARGPGSFTGIRIGVSTVKGLAWANEMPVLGVSTLEAAAYNGLTLAEGSLVCAVMDARRSQFYNALFEMHDGSPVRLCSDRAIDSSDLAVDIEKYKKPVYLVGDGAELCYNIFGKINFSAVLAPEPLRYQSAWGVCMAAAGKAPQAVNELLPVYLRLSQAERERQRKDIIK